MRIGFFTDTYLPSVRGIEISVETFRKVFEKMGHEVFVVAPKFPGYKDKNPNVYRFKSWRVIKKPEMRFALPPYPRSVYKEILNLKLDIIHAHNPFTIGLLAKQIAEKKNIPLVYTHHTHYPAVARAYFWDKIFLPVLVEKLVKWYANRADAVVAPSLKFKRMLRAYGVNKKVPIKVILTGINLNKFKLSIANGLALREKLKIDQKAKVLLFVGSVNQAKNVDFLFETLREIIKVRQDVVLVMAGDGDRLDPLREKSKKLFLEKNIRLNGFVGRKDIMAYYQMADVFTFASLTDTQGIVLLEAMACGVPVVTLKDDAFAGVVIDKQNGFIVPEELPNKFAEKILRLLDKPALYQAYSATAQKTASHFSKEKEATKMIKLYKSLLIKKKFN